MVAQPGAWVGSVARSKLVNCLLLRTSVPRRSVKRSSRSGMAPEWIRARSSSTSGFRAGSSRRVAIASRSRERRSGTAARNRAMRLRRARSCRARSVRRSSRPVRSVPEGATRRPDGADGLARMVALPRKSPQHQKEGPRQRERQHQCEDLEDGVLKWRADLDRVSDDPKRGEPPQAGRENEEVRSRDLGAIHR